MLYSAGKGKIARFRKISNTYTCGFGISCKHADKAHNVKIGVDAMVLLITFGVCLLFTVSYLPLSFGFVPRADGRLLDTALNLDTPTQEVSN